MAIASTRLCSGFQTGAGPNTLYTVPSDTRTIVKYLAFENTNASAQRVTVFLRSGATTFAQWSWWLDAAGTAGESVVVLFWQVLNAGESLAFGVQASGVHLIASGAELTTV